jgi:hypothetical protein
MTWQRTGRRPAPQPAEPVPFRELHPVAKVLVVGFCIALGATCAGLVGLAINFAIGAWHFAAATWNWFLS